MNTFVSVKDMNDSSETIFQNSQYRDLIQLIKYQREKINSQQADLTKVTIFSDPTTHYSILLEMPMTVYVQQNCEGSPSSLYARSSFKKPVRQKTSEISFNDLQIYTR